MGVLINSNSQNSEYWWIVILLMSIEVIVQLSKLRWVGHPLTGPLNWAPAACRSRKPSLFLHLVSSISLQNSRVYHRILSRGTYTHLSRGTLCRLARPLGARHCPHTTASVHGMQMRSMHALVLVRFGSRKCFQPFLCCSISSAEHGWAYLAILVKVAFNQKGGLQTHTQWQPSRTSTTRYFVAKARQSCRGRY